MVDKRKTEKKHRFASPALSSSGSKAKSSMLERLQLPVILVLLVLYISTLIRKPTEISGKADTSNVKRDQSLGSGSVSRPAKSFIYTGPQTTWTPWTHDFPCFPAEPSWKSIAVQRSPSRTGLLFVREMKTGSSTVAGIMLHIAHRRGFVTGNASHAETSPCRVRIDHSSASRLAYKNRDVTKSFLLSLLRDPTKRAISHFFHFQVSEKKQDPTDKNFQDFFRRRAASWSNYYVKDLVMNLDDLQKGFNDDDIVKEILSKYNFIAITERMDESLVVLKQLLGLQMEDILYMSAKTHGSFTTGPGTSPCIYIVPSFLTSGMKEFFESQYWKNYTRADQRLYDAAVQSLDNTIDALGRKKVEEELLIFRRARQYAQQLCEERTEYRCNSKGEYIGNNSTCYLWDIGCGNQCLNEISISKDVLK